MPESLRYPLSRQIAVRLALALLVTVLTTVGLAFWFYSHAKERFFETHLRLAKEHYAAALSLQDIGWERAAYNFKARLEFARVLEGGGERQGRLSNFITAQGGAPEYPFVSVLDRAGERLASFAYAKDRKLPAGFDGADIGWAYDEEDNRLFRVFRQQVWLGEGENGQLILYRPIDHALLGSLVYPETELLVLWHRRAVASSRGEDGIQAAGVDPGAGGEEGSSLIPWSPSQAGNPRILLRVKPNEPFSLQELFKPLSLGALIFVAVAWLIFGFWTTGLVRRVMMLGKAHREFAGTGETTPVVLAALSAVQRVREDELSGLARSLLGMMASVAEHRRSQEQAAEILRLSEERYRFLVEGVDLVAWEYSTETESFIYVSPQAAKLLGYPLAEWQQPNFLSAHAHPDDLPRVRESRGQAVEGLACALDYRLRHRDGHFVWVHHLSSGAAPGDPLPRQMVRGMLIDVSERKQVEQRLALAGQVFDTAAEGIMLTDAQNRIVSVNPAFEAITGYAPGDVMGKDPKFLNAGLQDPEYYKAMWHALARDGRWEGEVWNRRKSGEPFAQRLVVSLIRDEWGHVKNHLAMFSDMTTQKRQAEEIRHQADHDALTGLPNRRLLADRMAQAIARAQRQNGQVGMMMLDLDGFKHINDTLGHRIGDLLLIETARRLTHCVRESDTVARIGGDEFMVVLPELQRENDLPALATKILEHLRQRFHIEGKDMYVSGSIGLTMFPDDGTDTETLLANADTAMYRAKAEGKNGYRFFTMDMQRHAQERLRLETGLRRALHDGEFVLCYQPVFELASGALAKAEALIRWQDPVRGLVEPADFIPVAEDTGLIVPIGAWVMQEVARQAARWKDLAPPDFRLGINLSAQQFQRGDCAVLLGEVLDAEGADPRQLVVEITESVFISDKGEARRQLNVMKGFGIQVAIDDFGTGFSSLSYLKHFPVDTLKIDQSFVSGIPDDAEDVALIEAIISMSRALNLDVVAEGIETEAQRRFLMDSGCRCGQGYLLGRPVSAAEFAILFLSRPVSAPG